MTTALDRIKKERLHAFAAYLETTMTAYGVMPPHPVPAYCGARDDDTGRLCDLDQGHDGPHQSIITITWLDPADEPL